MKPVLKKTTLLKAIPLAVYLTLITVFLVRNGTAVVDSVLVFAQDHKVLSIWIFLLLFLLKSVSFGLPFVVLFAAVGAIYPFWPALFINCLGLCINLQIPYFLGRRRGSEYVSQIEKRFPVITPVLNLKNRSHFLFTFVLKLIGKIPHEIVNLVLGALGIRYLTAMAASVVALLPEIVSLIIMAREYKDPDSPAFIIAVILFLAVPAGSLLFYLINRRRSKEQEKADQHT